jgi:NADH-quinone oxidoreductase subunit L
MFFDELYESVFVAITIGFSRFIAWLDRIVIDGIVNGVSWVVRQMAVGVGNHDKYVIDGAVNGVGRLTYNLGAAVRTPERGRVRVYVTILILAIALGLAGAVIVVLS